MNSPHGDRERIDAARRGDIAARERLVGSHLPMVRRVAAAYRGFGLPYEDLVQEGSIGLLEAIDRFDESRGLDFESYARFRIRRSIRNALTEKARLIRLPKQIVERRRAIERAELRLRAAGAAAPTPAAIAASLGMAEPAIREARAAPVAGVSLEAAILPDGSPLEALIADEDAPDPQVETAAHEREELVDSAVAALPPRQREIVARHFGLGCEAERLGAVAESLHLSPQRTRTIERGALYALRESLENELVAPGGGPCP
jgi:RNA polymerase primary sigma factor